MESRMPDIKFRCPHCREVIEQPFEMLGQLIDCPACNETIEVQKPRISPKPPLSLHRAVPKLKIPKPPKRPGKLQKGKVYKVLTPKDKFYEGNYGPDKLEEAINYYAAKGWHVISVVATGPQQDVMVVMGRNT